MLPDPFLLGDDLDFDDPAGSEEDLADAVGEFENVGGFLEELVDVLEHGPGSGLGLLAELEGFREALELIFGVWVGGVEDGELITVRNFSFSTPPLGLSASPWDGRGVTCILNPFSCLLKPASIWRTRVLSVAL